MKEQMKILIAYDGSECADAAIDDLRNAGLPKQAQAIVFSVIENWLPPPSMLEIVEEVDYATEMRTIADHGVARIKRLMPDWDIRHEVTFNSPASAILEKADSWKPDLIVVGSHSRSTSGRFLFGSVSQKLLHDAHCTVRVGRDRKAHNRSLRIIIGVDGSYGSDLAVDLVACRQWPKETEVCVVNACWKIPLTSSEYILAPSKDWINAENVRVNKMIASALSKLKMAGLKVTAVMIAEEPRSLILSEAERWKADSIFVGARGMGLLKRLMIGSVSSSVGARAHCSVEVVRG